MIFIWVYGLVLMGGLAALSYIDIKSFRLPDVLTLPLCVAGLSFAYFYGDMTSALIGLVMGYLSFLCVELGFKYLRGIDGLGRGDAKLLAAGGAWCGWMALPHIVLIASISAICVVLLWSLKSKTLHRKSAIPFGPFIAIGIGSIWLVQTF